MFNIFLSRSNTLKKVFNSPEGKKALAIIADLADAYKPSFTGDPSETIHRDGRKALFFDVLSLIDSDHDTIRKQVETEYRQYQQEVTY